MSVINCEVLSVVLPSVVSSKRFVVVMVETTDLDEVAGSVRLDSIPAVVSITAFVGEASVANVVATVLFKVVAVVSEVVSFSFDTVLSVVEVMSVVSWSVT